MGSLMRDCVGSVLADFTANTDSTDDEGFMAAGHDEPEDMTEDFWPRWDLTGSGCLDGSVLVGGNMQEKLECQACPRGTVFVSRARGTMTMCRPCPSGSYMGETGAVMNDAGELGECNACPSDAYMTNVFPAYSKDQCQKTSCFPNRTKFQVVFVLDSSGSVTRPDYIRMREFSKSIVKRMCLNGGEAQEGKKSCGQAGYVIYNSSPESMLKFKQVETFEDFERIDNYEYRGGAPNDRPRHAPAVRAGPRAPRHRALAHRARAPLQEVRRRRRRQRQLRGLLAHRRRPRELLRPEQSLLRRAQHALRRLEEAQGAARLPRQLQVSAGRSAWVHRCVLYCVCLC